MKNKIINTQSPISFMSFDVEALQARATDNHIDRLIWGKTPQGEYGIRRLCKILDEHNIKGNFFVDIAGCAMYGDRQMREVFDFLLKQGHQVDVHLHSEWIYRTWKLKGDKTIFPSFKALDNDLNQSFLDYAVYKFYELTGFEPSVFRAGGVLFNQYTIEAAKKSGFKALSNFHYGRDKNISIFGDAAEANEPFKWENGMVEIPFDLALEPLSANFNNVENIYTRVKNRKKLKTFNLLNHSWSLLERDEKGFHTIVNPSYEEAFYKLCSFVKNNTKPSTYNDFLQSHGDNLPTIASVFTNDEIVVVKPDIRCLQCGCIYHNTSHSSDQCFSCDSNNLLTINEAKINKKEPDNALSASEPKRILIYGSCVSRDAFSYTERNKFEIIDYYARSSLGSSLSNVKCIDLYSDRIASSFQARMVKYDLTKTLEKTIIANNFDILLIDFIDERFDLALFEDGAIATLSNELISSGFLDNQKPYRRIKSQSDEFFTLWEMGWKKCVTLLEEQNCIEKLIINEVYWSDLTVNGDKTSSYLREQIESANNFLARLYERCRRDLQTTNFFTFDPSLLLGDDNHKWGMSPFHYRKEYYQDVLLKIEQYFFDGDQKQSSSYYDARLLTSISTFSANNIDSFYSSGNKRILSNHIEVEYHGNHGVYQCQYRFNSPCDVNGITIRFRLRGWESIRYVAIGYTYEKAFRHVRISKPVLGEWIDFSIGHHDLAYGLQNNWEHPDSVLIGDIRLYISGTPSDDGAYSDISTLACWREEPFAIASKPLTQKRDQSVLDAMYGYFDKCFRDSNKQAIAFLNEGLCPLYGETLLQWERDKALPDDLLSNGTYKFSWHSLHPSTILLVYARTTNDKRALYSARDFVTSWMERSYYQIDPDQKFTWYDHSTAERLMSMIVLYDNGEKEAFDCRFMDRLRIAIFRHAQLLSSELFYAYHQPIRYHNHAWFQDIALMCAALAFSEWECSKDWLKRAIERFEDQVNHLVIRESGYAVLSENSIGYHIGARRIIDFASELVRLGRAKSSIVEVSEEMKRFESLMRYPKLHAFPAYGDTFGQLICDEESNHEHENGCFILKESGYGVIRGMHDKHVWMIALIAGSQTTTHKHEDNLSFTLFFDGIEWLIDPSFYSHDYANPIPAYLRSTVAHNALVLKDHPYSINPGLVTLCEDEKDSNEEFAIFGEHRCYEKSTIRRHISGSTNALHVEFLDEILGEETRDGSLMFHCGIGVHVSCSRDGLVMLSHKDSRYQLIINLAYEKCKIYCGDNSENKLYGITGTGFMQSETITTIEYLLNKEQSCRWNIEPQR